MSTKEAQLPVAPTLQEAQKGIINIPYKGQEIQLTFDLVRRYLVTGKSELVTNQELMFFMGICKTRSLNPFNKDCYLIKYSQDPAQIIVSVDHLRSRARRQPDCRGWKCGIIVRPKGQKGGPLEFREGHFIIPGEEELLGGWFEAKPDGWDEPKKHTVPLSGYIKKKTSGEVTQFWTEEKQPMMIAKVAESQGLRTVWSEDLSMLYTEEELGGPDFEAMPMISADVGTEGFDSMMEGSIAEDERPAFLRFTEAVAAANPSLTLDEIKHEATKDWGKFVQRFTNWLAKNKPKEEPPKEEPPKEEPPKEEAPAEAPEAEPPGEDPGPAMMFPPEEDEQAPPAKQEDVKEQINQLMEMASKRKVPLQMITQKTGIANWMQLLDQPDKIPAVKAVIESVPPPKGK